jgi:hypothetical protein
MKEQKGKMTPEKAVQFLKDRDVFVTLEEAKKILDLMRIFVRLSVDQQFNK